MPDSSSGLPGKKNVRKAENLGCTQKQEEAGGKLKSWEASPGKKQQPIALAMGLIKGWAGKSPWEILVECQKVQRKRPEYICL